VLLRLRQGWQEWNLLGLSGEATLLAFELHVDDGPVYFFGVGVDEWSRASPFALDWDAPGCPAKFVVLVAFVSIGWAIGPKWLIRWSWDAPETPATYRYLDGTTPPTQVQWDQLSQALSRFHTLVIGPGRPRGGTLYTSDQLEVIVPHERSAFLERHGRPPYDSELAPLIGVSEATFKRYKARGMIPSS